jgi:general secretion pathway protein G
MTTATGTGRLPPATFAQQQCARRHGFTLIELMLVVGLIAVLATLAWPKYNDYRDRIRVNQAKLDIVMMATRITLYWQDAHEYPSSLAAVGLGEMLDPWGRPYQYLNLQSGHGLGQARKDHSLVPINTDFDLYSMGPDGRSAPPLTSQLSRDDIVRANNGQFVGPASSY